MNVLALRQICEAIPNWWTLNVGDLMRLAEPMFGRRPGSWVRQGSERAIVAKTKFGAVATNLPQELAALSRDACAILAKRQPGYIIAAVAYYHVRFENIHPLIDGNGRIGRTLMAGQLFQENRFSPAAFERQLEGNFVEYKCAFRASTSEETYQLLTGLLHQITKLPAPSVELIKEFSFMPIQQSPGSPTRS